MNISNGLTRFEHGMGREELGSMANGSRRIYELQQCNSCDGLTEAILNSSRSDFKLLSTKKDRGEADHTIRGY